MATPSACSQVSSRESEPVKECRLVLTTLLGSAVEMTTSVVKRDRLEDLEDHVVDYLASVTDLDVFGCTLDFVHPTMQTYLEDPIWEVLQTNTQFTIVLRDCLAFLHSKESFDGCPYRDIPQAVQVPTNLAGIVPAGAFIAVPRLRHVSVAAGINAIGAEAWQSCRHLRVVRMPSIWCELRITPSEGASCSTASQRQAVWNLATKHLQTVVPYSGSMPMGEGLTSSEVQPNLATTSFETA